MKADEWLKADETRLAQVTTTKAGRLQIELLAVDQRNGSGKSFARAEGETIGDAAMNLERAWPVR